MQLSALYREDETMRMTRIFMALAALAFAASLIASPASAQRGQGRAADRERPDRIDRMAERLDLTDEQKAGIERIMEAGREKAVTHRKEMARLRHEMKGEMLKDDPGESALQKTIERIGALRTKHQVDRMKDRMAIRRLLTPEQRDRWLMMGSGCGFAGERRAPRMRVPGRRGPHQWPGIRGLDIQRWGRSFRDRSGLDHLDLDLDLDPADLMHDLDVAGMMRDLDTWLEDLRRLPGICRWDWDEDLPKEETD